MIFRKLIGDRAFYRRLVAVMTPWLIHDVITNFVSLLDNGMVGQVGTEPMSGVAIVNQLMFVFNLCIFGGLAGAGIFTAQFYGKGDHEGVRHTFRAKLYIAIGSILIFAAVFLTRGEQLISLFLHQGEENLDLAATLRYGRDYMLVMLLGMPPFAVMQVYASTLRETGETLLPMKAGVIAVFVNLVLNYILIFGKLGAPALGVEGAAIATVIARFTECFIVIGWTHLHRERNPFIQGCYSLRGLEVVSAINISTTVSNLFFCAFLSMGTTVSIVIGQLLGAGELEKAVDEDRKLIAFSVALCVVVGIVMALIAPLVPEIYNTTPMVKRLAAELLFVSAAMMPVNAFTNSCYFTLRSGGKTIITFIFDSAFVWVICIPTAFVLSRFTDMAILPMFIIVQALDLIKCVVGFYLVKARKWVNNLVAE